MILDAIGNLRALGSEAFLAIFGIIIGTAAVIAILHVGHNARAEAMRQFEALGTDLISIALQDDAMKGELPGAQPGSTTGRMKRLALA